MAYNDYGFPMMAELLPETPKPDGTGWLIAPDCDADGFTYKDVYTDRAVATDAAALQLLRMRPRAISGADRHTDESRRGTEPDAGANAAANAHVTAGTDASKHIADAPTAVTR